MKGFLLCALLLLLSISMYGVELNRKLSGSATMLSSQGDITVNLASSVDLTKSILLFSIRVSDADVGEVNIGGELASSTTVEFHRSATGSEVNIEWQVLEFSNGISVQRGTFPDVDGTETVTISSVNTSQSFATVNFENDGVTMSADDGLTIDIVSATSVEIENNQNNIVAAYWQVIECADCNVQKIYSTLGNGSATRSETISSVNTAKTLLFTSQRIGGNVEGNDLPRTELTNNTTITHTRSGTTASFDLLTYVVEFTDATTVQHGSVLFAASELTNSPAISAVDENISLVYSAGALGYQGSSTNGADDNPGSNWFTMNFSSGTSLSLERALGTYSGEVTYQVAEFLYYPPTTWYTFGGGGNWSDTATWTLNGSGLAYVNPYPARIPGPEDQVVIMGSNGAAVTMDINNVTIAGLDNSGELYVGTTSGHDFTSISGNGTIYLSGSGGFDNFPDGGIALFADTIVGGTVEYNGTGLTMDQSRTFNNFILNLDNSTDDLVLLNDLTVNGDFTLTQGDFQINDNSSITILNLSVGKSALVDANASISVGQGDTRNPYTTGSPPATIGTYHDIFHQVTFYGDFTNQGSVRFTNQAAPVYNAFTTTGGATVIFAGAKDNTVSLFGTTDFYNLIIDKGTDQTFVLEIDSDNVNNFALYGPNNVTSRTGGVFTAADPEIRKALWIYHGTLKFSGYINIPSLTEGNEDYIIGGSGALVLDGANVHIYSTATVASEVPGGSATGINTGSGNQAMTLQGKFQINNGTFGTRNSAGFIFRDISSGEVIVNGGTINVSQFRSSTTGAGSGKLSYIQSGGTVLVRNDISEAGERNQGYALFSLNTQETVFTMSGGTITTYGRTDGGTIFLNSAPGNYSITGGDINVEIGDNEEPVITSHVPFWNLTLDKIGGSAAIINVDTETSGGETILDPDLIVLNNLTIKSGVTLDHEGNDVEVGSDFVIENGGDYVYDSGKPNTTTVNGIDNSIMAFYNRTGGSNDEQRFWNLIIDKPSDKVVTLLSGKTNVNNNNNNLLRIDGNYLKVLSGTLDQGVHSIRLYTDTLVNYDVLSLYNPVGAGTDSNPNSDNDLVKFRPDPFVLITADSSKFGNVRLNNGSNITTLISDVYMQRMEYRHGRINMQSYNLKIDDLYFNLNASETDWNGCGGCNSVEDMLISNGNVSDGGLSLYVDADETLTFPIGVGADGLDADVDTGSGTGNSKYTPAQVTISNFTDDGYITIRPVDRQLATTDPIGGDILSYYWKVSFSDFTPGSEPNISYQFKYYDADLDLSFNENLFVPGKVLEVDPFTRSSEVIGNMNTTDNFITFNGNTGGGASPFTLEVASYTAGEPERFVGAPTIYYSINTSPANWTNTNSWSLTRDGASAGSYPGPGDIAILTRDDGGPGDPTSYGAGVFYINNGTGAISVAKLIFDDVDPVNNNWISGCPRVIFDTNGGYTAYASNLGSVEVSDNHIGGPVPNQSHGAVLQYNVNSSYTGIFPGGDYGDFNSYENALVIYAWDAGTGTTTLAANATEYPMLWFQGGNSNNRIIYFPDTDVKVHGRANINGGMLIRVNNGNAHTLTFRNFVEIGSGCCGDGFFEFDGNSIGDQTVIIEGDLLFNNTNGGEIRLTNNSGTNTHHLIVKSDIDISANGSMDLGDGSNSVVDLELQGLSNNSFTNLGSATLHRIIMNKGTNQGYSFSFEDGFTLTGATNGSSKAIQIDNGTLVLNDPTIDVDLSTGGSDFSIPVSGALQITQGTASVSGSDIGILLNGSIIIDGGTINMDDAVGNGNNYIEYGAAGNASIEISSGSLVVGSQIRTNVAVPSGILSYTQTGGDVIVGKNAAAESATGVFEVLNTGSSFTYTGGTLTLVRQNTAAPGVAALRLLPTFSDVTETIYIGSTDTPANQDDFGINANVPLAGLTITGTNSPTAVIMVNDLTLTDQLTIESGATLDGNGIDLTLEADFANDGTYTPNGNATIFNSEGVQNISGTGTTGFYDFYKIGNGTLNTSISFQVDNNFFLSLGTFDDNGNTIDLKGNVEINGTHQSTGAVGEGLRLSGIAAQQLTRSEPGNSSVGIFTLQNNNGVFIPEGGGYNFTINDELKMNGGVFNIGSSEVTIGANADISTTGTYSVANMVRTNSTFNDNGLVKVFPAGYNGAFLYPMGEDYYTPVTVDCSVAGGTSGSTTGSIAVRPANEYHPTIDDGTDNIGGGARDIDNVLQYYWTLRANNLNGYSGDIIFQYDQNDVSITASGYTEADYIPARILAFNNPTYLVNKYSASDVNETNNEILFTASTVFGGVDENGISGDYFCGIDDAIPNNVATYTVILNGGSASDGNNTYSPTVPGGGAPSGAVVIIPGGFELVFDNNSIELYKTEIQNGATLTIENTKFHRLGILEGTGTLKIVHDIAGNPTLPLADYGTFFSCSGGNIEYSGTGSYSMSFQGQPSIRNLTLSGSGARTFPNMNMTICEDLIVNGPDLDGFTDRSLVVSNDITVLSGSFYAFSGTSGSVAISNDLIVDGGNYVGASSGKTQIMGDLNLTSGLFSVGSSNYTVDLWRDFNFTGGSFDAGNTNTLFSLRTNPSRDQNSILNGEFTGTNAFYNLRIYKASIGTTVDLNGDIEIENQLNLIEGIINTNSNGLLVNALASVSPNGGKESSYISGRVVKTLSTAGDDFVFPIGGPTRYRPAYVQDVSVGGLDWEAEYIQASPATDPDVSNLTSSDPSILTMSTEEYWRITDGNAAASGVTATVGLSWGNDSYVSAISAEREQLRVMVWNGTNSNWDNFGGANYSGGHTEDFGMFNTNSAVSFSEKIFTLGSTDLSNPLPVELVSFAGKEVDGKIMLSWETASELNNDFFVVEHSLDGKSFREIGQVEGAGTTHISQHYGFLDQNPAYPDNYYRLKQVDFDGVYEYSDVILVHLNKIMAPEDIDFIMYPNPTADNSVMVKLTSVDFSKPLALEIVNLGGRLLYSYEYEPTDLQTEFTLDLGYGTPRGIYLVRIIQPGNSIVKKLVLK